MRALDRNSKCGYTLLEITVVLALFAILLSIAIPSSGLIANVREKDELNRFRRDIIAIRTNAIVENRVYTLSLDTEKNTYIIRKFNSDKDKVEVVKTVELKNGLVLQKNDSSKSSIDFKSTGAPSVGTTIHLFNRKGQKVEITIAPATGSINIKIENKTI